MPGESASGFPRLGRRRNRKGRSCFMSWEFEDLFNNKRTEDGGFLAEPCFIPVGKMGYRRRTTVSDQRIDAEVYPVFGRQMRGALRRARKNKTAEAQRKANIRRSQLKAIQIIEANFTKYDVALGLSYAGKCPDQDRIDKDIRNFVEKVKRLRKKMGLPELKYFASIGGDEMPSPGYSGKRPHVHVFMSGGIDRDVLEKMWGHGTANCDRLQPNGNGLAAIAVYFTKQIYDRQAKPGTRRWRASKNLIHPVPKGRDAKMPNSRVRKIAYGFENEAKGIMEKLYPGYVFESVEVKYSDFVPGVYIRCVMRKIGGGEK